VPPFFYVTVGTVMHTLTRNGIPSVSYGIVHITSSFVQHIFLSLVVTIILERRCFRAIYYTFNIAFGLLLLLHFCERMYLKEDAFPFVDMQLYYVLLIIAIFIILAIFLPNNYQMPFQGLPYLWGFLQMVSFCLPFVNNWCSNRYVVQNIILTFVARKVKLLAII